MVLEGRSMQVVLLGLRLLIDGSRQANGDGLSGILHEHL